MGLMGCRGIRGYWGGYIWKMQMVCCKVLLKMQDNLLQMIDHELRSMGPKLVPLLATKCLYLGALSGHRGWWGGDTSDKTSAWPTGCWLSFRPAVVPVLTTICLYWGWVTSRGWQGAWGCQGAYGVTYEKWRWSIAKYFWKLKMVYCRQ